MEATKRRSLVYAKPTTNGGVSTIERPARLHELKVKQQSGRKVDNALVIRHVGLNGQALSPFVVPMNLRVERPDRKNSRVHEKLANRAVSLQVHPSLLDYLCDAEKSLLHGVLLVPSRAKTDSKRAEHGRQPLHNLRPRSLLTSLCCSHQSSQRGVSLLRCT